ncbi:Uncharacterised protein [Metamycoplasma alkalescens]|uniref:Uncharacterized protein n=1 Tax=Metamycoplasma alkalescens TaxID=45363 RepID=A0A3B0PDG0_9BACT|nr:Uncharacterised protein [Metamycoplasma alkalescens]
MLKKYKEILFEAKNSFDMVYENYKLNLIKTEGGKARNDKV